MAYVPVGGQQKKEALRYTKYSGRGPAKARVRGIRGSSFRCTVFELFASLDAETSATRAFVASADLL